MKKLLFILLFILFSCEKETCWECYLTRTGVIGNTTVSQESFITTMCDKTEAEILILEQPAVTYVGEPSRIITVTTTRRCIKK